MAGSIFGLGENLKTTAACISLICIIVFTVLFELFTLHLDKKMKGSIYKEMVDKVYRELTILGVISFLLFITLQSGAEIDHDTLIAFEFSHIVIFFSALFFIVGSIFMMLLNVSLKKAMDIAYARTSKKVFENFALNENQYTSKWASYLPWHRQFFYDVDFKVFQLFFCEQNNLPHSVFDFAAYMRIVLDEHILSLIEVEISSWLFLIAALGGNVIRSEYLGSISHNGISGSRFLAEDVIACDLPSAGRKLGGGPCSEAESTGLMLFIISGWALLGGVGMLKFAARRNELALLKIIGVSDIRSSLKFIKEKEEVLGEYEEHLKNVVDRSDSAPTVIGGTANQYHKILRVSRTIVIMVMECKRNLISLTHTYQLSSNSLLPLFCLSSVISLPNPSFSEFESRTWRRRPLSRR